MKENNSVMKCCICDNKQIGEFITINNKKYHLCCIEQLEKEYDKALQILVDFYPPCERDGFMDKNAEYCSMNCGVDEEVFKECWRRYIRQEIESGKDE